MTHTKGPWVVTPHPETHVDVFGVGELMDDKEVQYALSHTICYLNAEANARLISVAPELLEFIEHAAHQLEAGIQEYPGGPEEPPQPASQWDYDAGQLVGELRQLIAKAKGETP